MVINMYVIRVAYIDCEITVICPLATQNDAMNFAYNIAKKKFNYDMPETYEDMMMGETGFIEMLSDDAQFFIPKNIYLE